MFNLSQQRKPIQQHDLLRHEMNAIGIINRQDGYLLQLGDEEQTVQTLGECKDLISKGLKELKKHGREKWDDLAHLANFLVLSGGGEHHPSLDNLLFLNSVKKSYLLSKRFSELKEVTGMIKLLFFCDVKDMSSDLICKYNMLYLRIKLIHHLIMHEIYRTQVISAYMQMTKEAQISGPWANLDLPMRERVWDWDENENADFTEKNNSVQEQIRYNPENTLYNGGSNTGFYFSFADFRRDPWSWEDRQEDSIYPSENYFSQP